MSAEALIVNNLRTVGQNRKLTRIGSRRIDISCCASRAKSPVRAMLIANLSIAADQSGLRAD